jgi:uncharacterized protein YegP (UPF0339 family)
MLKFQISRDGAGFFRWALVSPSSRAVALSSERFTTFDSCWRSAQQVKSGAYGAAIEDLTSGGSRGATP